MKNETTEIFTLGEVATYFKVGKRTVYRLGVAKGISVFKVGGTWRVLRHETDQWIKRQTTEVQGNDVLGVPGSEYG